MHVCMCEYGICAYVCMYVIVCNYVYVDVCGCVDVMFHVCVCVNMEFASMCACMYVCSCV
jgi:hypothetical protein